MPTFLFCKIQIVSFANDEIVEKAILLLKDIYIHLGPQLKVEQVKCSGDQNHDQN